MPSGLLTEEERGMSEEWFPGDAPLRERMPAVVLSLLESQCE